MSAGTVSRGRVCIFAPYLWPLFSDEAVPAIVGGAEVQQAAIARGLVARGFEVRVATCDFGQGRTATREGITFHATHTPFGGVRVLRFFHPRVTGSLRALRAADADLYYVRVAGFPAGLAAGFAGWARRAFVFSAAHDFDAGSDLRYLPQRRARWAYRRAIRGAGAIIAQTETQRDLFRANWGREAEVIPNLVELPDTHAEAGRDGPILWLATYKASKRPEWVADLARRLPQWRFEMAGVIPPPPLTGELFEQARRAAATLPNLTVQGTVGRTQVPALLDRAALLVQTSPAEGFSNTLLEAWAHALPTLSVVDPDGVIARERLGDSATDPATLALAVDRWMRDPAARREAGQRARAYVEARHSASSVVDRLAAVFDREIARARRRG
jgi:glycosyltransferase involved in cell wall biosynthesis